MTSDTIGERLRAARVAAGLSLAVMAARTHYSRSLLSLVENGKRTATSGIVAGYERVLGVGLGEDVNRREFLITAGLVAGNVKVATGLLASIAGNDASPLLSVQTTHGTDMALATIADRATVTNLRRWLDDSNPVLRVNAAGILAKLPGQQYSARVAALLDHDADVRTRYMTAVVSRVCGVDRPTAAVLVNEPQRFPHPALVARRFAREALSDHDVGARWCSARMLQLLSPMVGR